MMVARYCRQRLVQYRAVIDKCRRCSCAPRRRDAAWGIDGMGAGWSRASSPADGSADLIGAPAGVCSTWSDGLRACTYSKYGIHRVNLNLNHS